MTYSTFYRQKVINCYKKHNMTISQTAVIFEISRKTIYNWIKLYDKNELSPNRVRKQKIKNDVINFIKTYVLTDHVFNYKILLNLIAIKYKINISKSTVYNILKENNITRKKVITKIIKKDLIMLKKDTIEFKNKIKTINKDNIISIDETSIDLHINPLYG